MHEQKQRLMFKFLAMNDWHSECNHMYNNKTHLHILSKKVWWERVMSLQSDGLRVVFYFQIIWSFASKLKADVHMSWWAEK